MDVDYIRIDTQGTNFEKDFLKYEKSISYIFKNTYKYYYGFDYHKQRILESNAIIYLAFTNKMLIGVSYVKENCRRGGTAVFPEEYRCKGIAKSLVILSLKDFPTQYSILSTNLKHSPIMFNLLLKNGFKKVKTKEQIKIIVKDEYNLLNKFRKENGFLLFDRKSERRKNTRKSLTLLNI